MTDSDPLVRTRLGLHAVAEHVLAGDLHRHTGSIRLRVVPGGFGTDPYPVGGEQRRLRVDGADLVVERDGTPVARGPITTLAATAHLAGAPVAAPVGVYDLATDPDPDRPLGIDPALAGELADWLAAGDAALAEVFGPGAERTLWPEHLDLGLSVGEVNYGVSLGDAGRPEPYVYVGPWAPPPVDGFWNEPYGAARSWTDLTTAAAIAAFFREASDPARLPRG